MRAAEQPGQEDTRGGDGGAAPLEPVRGAHRVHRGVHATAQGPVAGRAQVQLLGRAPRLSYASVDSVSVAQCDCGLGRARRRWGAWGRVRRV